MKHAVLILTVTMVFHAPSVFSQPGGGYISFGSGTSSLEDGLYGSLADGSLITGTSVDNSDSTISIAAGYNLTDITTIELGYIDFGEFSTTGISDGTGFYWFSGPVIRRVGGEAYTFSVIGSLPLGNSSSFNAKVGLYSAKITEELIDTCCIDPYKESNMGMHYAIGATLDFSDTIAGKVEFSKFLDVGGDEVGGEDNISVFGANLIIKY